jgi:deoxyribonuclease V
MHEEPASEPPRLAGSPGPMWPSTAEALEAEQRRLATLEMKPWTPPPRTLVVAGCFICFADASLQGTPAPERAWAGAVLLSGRRPLETRVVGGFSDRPYEPGLLALREGHLLATALTELEARPDVVMVNATGRDHPRRAGLALHIGAVLDIPTVGVTDRPLVATGEPSRGRRGERAPLRADGELVAQWVVSRPGARPIAVHAAWRTTPDIAADVVLRCVRRARTPEPIRRARRAARLARAAARGGSTNALDMGTAQCSR